MCLYILKFAVVDRGAMWVIHPGGILTLADPLLPPWTQSGVCVSVGATVEITYN